MSPQVRYSPAQQALHWLTALGMFTAIPLAWLMLTATEGTAFSDGLYRWHETVGLFVLALTSHRLILRKMRPPPPPPAALARWDRWAAHATYVLLYALLIWMPITGFLATTALGYPPKLLNLVDTPALFAADKGLADRFAALHAWAQWPMYSLIVLHLAGVGFQLLVTRSGVLGRMLPEHSMEPAAENADVTSSTGVPAASVDPHRRPR